CWWRSYILPSSSLPRSTPFPTRRSSDLAGCPQPEPASPGPGAGGGRRHRLLPHLAQLPPGGTPFGRAAPPLCDSGEPRRDRLQRDRKSTRLNSSHVSISYAVFVLNIKSV